jgi:hypothetical protein
MKKICAAILIITAMIAALSCGCKSNASPSSAGPEGTATITPTFTAVPSPGTFSGTITGLSNDQAGKNLYITLDMDLDYADGYAARLTLTASSGTSIAYSFPQVAGGHYNVSAWIDMDSNTIPGVADYYGSYGATYPAMPAVQNVEINGDTAGIDITVVKLTANVSGTITFPGDAAGKKYIVAIDNDNVGTNGGQRTYYSDYCATPGPTTAVNYSLCVPFPMNNFTVYCLVSMNGHLLATGKESGDYVNFVPGNNLADPAFPVSPINFSLIKMP